MTRVFEVVETVRSKNAGPFWLTIDIFCGNPTAFNKVCSYLNNKKICDRFEITSSQIERYEMVNLSVIKFSLPRPQIQGSLTDRDMHGATWASLIYDIELY